MSENKSISGFFKRNLSLDNSVTPDKAEPKSEKVNNDSVKKANVSMRVNPEISLIMNDAVKALNEVGLKSFVSEISNIEKEINKQKFTVAIVGEFSRGKSTFINRMLGKDFLPVANMPTTAMLTRIRYSSKEAITILDAKNKTRKTLPLSVDSWNDYIADDEGNDPDGVAFVGINSLWLKNGIEIIDTPGAGDLEAKRAALIGDALKGSDSAVITVSAEKAMSMSEKLFIEERLIAKKTPFLMLVITKLDRIELSQRNKIVDFVKTKLDTWKMSDIPVFVPYDISMPDDKYKDIVGMDKVIGKINSWIVSSERKALTEQWLALKLAAHLRDAVNYATEKKCLLDAETDSKKQELVKSKSEKLEKAEALWSELKDKMNEKCDECYDLFLAKSSEYKDTMIEKLQYEVMHTGNVKKWWEEDYPYRLKIEMANMAVSIENVISRQIAKDVAWLNSVLDKNFKMAVIYTIEDIADKAVYTQTKPESEYTIRDMSLDRNLSRIGITALSIAAALACTSFGAASIIGSMGVGTGGSILSETFFKKKNDDQRESIKAEIAKCTPNVVHNAMEHSEKRIKNIYADIIAEASAKQDSWLESQKEMIAASTDNNAEGTKKKLAEFLNAVSSIQSKLEKHISL